MSRWATRAPGGGPRCRCGRQDRGASGRGGGDVTRSVTGGRRRAAKVRGRRLGATSARARLDEAGRTEHHPTPRRSGRVVEGNGFENRRTFTGTGGSNPSSSAESLENLGSARSRLKHGLGAVTRWLPNPLPKSLSGGACDGSLRRPRWPLGTRRRWRGRSARWCSTRDVQRAAARPAPRLPGGTDR